MNGIAHVTAGPIDLQQQPAPTFLEIFGRRQTSPQLIFGLGTQYAPTTHHGTLNRLALVEQPELWNQGRLLDINKVQASGIPT